MVRTPCSSDWETPTEEGSSPQHGAGAVGGIFALDFNITVAPKENKVGAGLRRCRDASS